MGGEIGASETPDFRLEDENPPTLGEGGFGEVPPGPSGVEPTPPREEETPRKEEPDPPGFDQPHKPRFYGPVLVPLELLPKKRCMGFARGLKALGKELGWAPVGVRRFLPSQTLNHLEWVRDLKSLDRGIRKHMYMCRPKKSSTSLVDIRPSAFSQYFRKKSKAQQYWEKAVEDILARRL